MTVANRKSLRASVSSEIVYFISSYVGRQMLERLIRRISVETGSTIVVRHDFSASSLAGSWIFEEPNVIVLRDDVTVEWGGAGEAELILQSLHWIETHLEYTWVVYLSEQDYPIRSLRKIERDLLASSADCYLDGGPVSWGEPFPAAAEGFLRYHYRYTLDDVVEPGEAASRSRSSDWPELNSGRLTLPPKIHRQSQGRLYVGELRGWPFTAVLAAGVCWSDLNRHAVRSVLDFYQEHPEIKEHLYEGLAPCEAILQTALYTGGDVEIAPHNQRLVKWGRPGDSRPGLWGIDEFDMLIRSGRHFARKFGSDADARDLIDALDARVLK